MDGAHDTTSSYSTHIDEQSSSHHLVDRSLARNMVELSDTEPITVPQAAAPTDNVSADHPSYKEMLDSEYSASMEPKLIGLESTLNSGTNHDIIPLSTTLKLLNKGFEINSKEEVKSLDDRYHLCYSTELSDSSVDEDKNWQAGPKFPDTAIIATGDGLIMEDNTNCGRLSMFNLVSRILVPSMAVLYFAELDIICDDQQQCISHSVQADCECVSPSKWKVLDHSSSLLHAMTLQHLRQLFLSLEQQLSGKWCMHENL